MPIVPHAGNTHLPHTSLHQLRGLAMSPSLALSKRFAGRAGIISHLDNQSEKSVI